MAELSADGTKILNNYDRFTGEPFNATKISTWKDGTPMSDSKVDNTIYFKNTTELGGGYSKRDFTGDIHVKHFGVLEDSSADQSAYLQRALDVCESLDIPLKISGNITLKRQIKIGNIDLIGELYNTNLIISTDFLYTEIQDGKNYATFLNKSFGGNKNSTANSFSISNIKVTYLENRSNISNTIHPSVFCFANIDGVTIDWCTIYIPNTSTQSCTGIDIWACASNVKISNTTVNNEQQSLTGGSIWVRNITSNGALPANDVSEIHVSYCNVTHATKDEPVAFYGVRGMTRNCSFTNSYVLALSSSQSRSVLISAFPLNDGSAGGINAAVRDVQIMNNTFEDDYFKDHILRIGQSGTDSTRVCDNITVADNVFKTKKTISDTNSYIARNIKCVGDNNTFRSNTISVTGTGKVTYGTSGFDDTDSNYISGNISIGANGGNKTRNNTFIVKDTGILDSNIALNNTIVSEGNGILVQYKSNVLLDSNKITLTATTGAFHAVFFQSLAGSTPSGVFSKNTISLNNSAAYVVRKQGSGAVIVKDNSTTGTGKTVVASGGTLKELTGNLWYGISEISRDAILTGVFDADYINAAPIGTRFNKDTVALDNITGFVKLTTNQSSSADWGATYRDPSNFISGLYTSQKNTNVSAGGFVRSIQSAYGLQFDGTNYVVKGTDTRTFILHDNNKISFGLIPSTVAADTALTYSQLQTYVYFEILSDSIRAGQSTWNSDKLFRIGGYYIWFDSATNMRVKSSKPTSDIDGTIVGNQGTVLNENSVSVTKSYLNTNYSTAGLGFTILFKNATGGPVIATKTDNLTTGDWLLRTSTLAT